MFTFFLDVRNTYTHCVDQFQQSTKLKPKLLRCDYGALALFLFSSVKNFSHALIRLQISHDFIYLVNYIANHSRAILLSNQSLNFIHLSSTTQIINEGAFLIKSTPCPFISCFLGGCLRIYASFATIRNLLQLSAVLNFPG